MTRRKRKLSRRHIFSVYWFDFPDGKQYWGKTNSEQGWREHGKGNHLVDKAMHHFGRENCRPHVYRSGLTEKQAFDLEIWMITERGSQYPGGYNVMPGGEGISIEDSIIGGKIGGKKQAKGRAAKLGLRFAEYLRQNILDKQNKLTNGWPKIPSLIRRIKRLIKNEKQWLKEEMKE